MDGIAGNSKLQESYIIQYCVRKNTPLNRTQMCYTAVMRVYAAYHIDEDPSRMMLARGGFSWLALLVPVLWLAYRRMWLETCIYIALSLIILLWTGVLSGFLLLALHLFLGFEANALYEESLSRRGYHLGNIVLARNRLEAERLVFDGRGQSS